MPTPTGPSDWHLALGLWQWDHSSENSDYFNSNPTVKLYDYESGYSIVYDLHRIDWGNKATCAALYTGPGY
jgi:hypothetical protein